MVLAFAQNFLGEHDKIINRPRLKATNKANSFASLVAERRGHGIDSQQNQSVDDCGPACPPGFRWLFWGEEAGHCGLASSPSAMLPREANTDAPATPSLEDGVECHSLKSVSGQEKLFPLLFIFRHSM